MAKRSGRRRDHRGVLASWPLLSSPSSIASAACERLIHSAVRKDPAFNAQVGLGHDYSLKQAGARVGNGRGRFGEEARCGINGAFRVEFKLRTDRA